MSAAEKAAWCRRLLAALAEAKTPAQADAAVCRAMNEPLPAKKGVR